MRRFLYSVLLVISVVLVLSQTGQAASDRAVQLRKENALSDYTPPEAFLSGNFVADEIEPGFIFGKVQDFVKSRSCPTSWLIEEGEKQRIESHADSSGPFECTLYLEEDCPGKVTHYVFIDRSRSSQWMEWRKQFHKNKAEPLYGAVKAGLEQAAQGGFPVNGELRFITVNGDLQLKKPEEMLTGELKFQPIYDVKQGKPAAR